MSITPPDPGRALQLAKDNDHDATALAFRRPGTTDLRWLYPEGARTWVACTTAERTISAATYAILRAGSQNARQEGTALFTSGTATYVLVDTGYEAKAELA